MSAPLFPLPPLQPEKKLPLAHRRDIWSRVTWGVKVVLLMASLPKNMERRRRCRGDFLQFCETYFPTVFYDLNRFHREFAAELQRLILSKSPMLKLKALAAPRGIGKTTICVLAIIWAALYGHSKFAIVFSSTSPNAAERLTDIKSQILRNELLFEDFPEICGPVREFGGDARAAAGAKPGYPWSNDLIRLSNGAYIASFGMDSAVAGRLKDFLRPDLMLIDDMETYDSVISPSETKKLSGRLFQEIMGLPGFGRHAVLLFICTIKVKNCVSDELSDAEINPEWRGQRYRALETFPKAEGLWNVFMEFIKPNGRTKPDAAAPEQELSDEKIAQFLEVPWSQWQEYTDGYRAALRFYVQRKSAMDEGAVLLDSKRLPLHQIYYERANKGETAWFCEIQNDPLLDENKKDLQLEVEALLKRAIGGPRRIVPDWASFVTFTIDMGKYICYWQVDAWTADCFTSCLIDQGMQETNLNKGGEYKMEDSETRRNVMIVDAVRFALDALDVRVAEGYVKATGEVVIPSLVGVDCGGTAEKMAWYEIVLKFCATRPKWIPLKGADWQMRRADRAMARNWICEQESNPGRRHDCNADEYKTRIYNSLNAPLMTPDGKLYRGTRIFHSAAPHEYCRQLTAEKWVEELKEEARSGKELKVGWNHLTRIPNHFWDTSWMSSALADIYRFIRSKPAPPRRVLPRTDASAASHDSSLG